MKFNLCKELHDRVDDEVRIGDVYPCQGGKGETAYWIVVGENGNWKSVKLLGINKDGEVVQTASYNTYNIADRPKVGYVEGLAELTFDVTLI